MRQSDVVTKSFARNIWGLLAFAILAGFVIAPIDAHARVEPWRITKETWTESDERGFQEFVAALGEADCWSVNSCFNSSANPYRHTHGRMTFRADCADLPYLLRAYYAWQNGLPFTYQNGVVPRSGWSRDYRYTRGGNRVVSRKDVPATANGVNAQSIMVDLRTAISTASFRHDASSDEFNLFTDMYSPALNRDAIVPGTSIYDVNGHVVVVWRVEDDGRILTLSAHPDNSVSRSFYGRNFLRTHPRMGTGFKQWRPIRLVGASRLANGTLVGGRIEPTVNDAIPTFSMEQYIGTNGDPDNRAGFDAWRQASFVRNGEALDYYHYVRAVMARGNLRMEPVREMRSAMRSLCFDIRARSQAVDAAISNGIDRMSPPDKLPANIYGTFGYWEMYSTPSRDARLKTSFKEMRDHIEALINMNNQGASTVLYEGTDIVGDLIRTYDEESQRCVTSYRRSNGQSVALSIEDVRERLFDISFDPYQCAERRWGARDPEELSSCRDGAVKTRWYQAQRFLRNQIDRTYDAFMGYSPAELEAGPHTLQSGRGVASPPDVDVRTYLMSLRGTAQASAAAPATPIP